ncbi:MAG: copper-binding protein [Beijerinckiaceae bacterium]|nr:copper-binding protein [Beijerinckiaceae bacterium]
MKNLTVAAIASLAIVVGAVSASAQGAPATPTVAGTIKKVDAEQGKVTIDHAKIPNLDMDAMSMVWKVKDPEMLKGLKAGDKVKFTADRVDGALTVTSIKK